MPGVERVVIVGGGFGGLYAARALRREPAMVTLIDRRNFHLFQPLLYQVATGALSPANITAPLRAVLRGQRNTRVMLGEAVDVDVAGRHVLLRDGAAVSYDTLIMAAGAANAYFGHADWQSHAPGLKTIEDATAMRRRILTAFEQAERAAADGARDDAIAPLLTFVVIGGGPTGVELSGAIAEIARHTLRRDFRCIRPAQARILLIDAAERVLPAYPADLSARARVSLERLGVSVRTGVKVAGLDEAGVTVETHAGTERIVARTVLWAAGIAAVSLGQKLAAATGAERDRQGRIFVAGDLTIPGHPEIVVMGDLANCRDARGQTLPGVAPVAMQQGDYAARLIRARRRGTTLPPFAYHDRGSMATIGRSQAVADLGWIRFGGWWAWVTWLFVHLMYLIQFENRLLVLVQWGWNYLTWNRSARLITESPEDHQ